MWKRNRGRDSNRGFVNCHSRRWDNRLSSSSNSWNINAGSTYRNSNNNNNDSERRNILLLLHRDHDGHSHRHLASSHAREDLYQYTIVLGLEVDGRLVGLDDRDGIPGREGFALDEVLVGDGARVHRGGEGGHSDDYMMGEVIGSGGRWVVPTPPPTGRGATPLPPPPRRPSLRD